MKNKPVPRIIQCCGYNCMLRQKCKRHIETIAQRNKGKLIEKCNNYEKFKGE